VEVNKGKPDLFTPTPKQQHYLRVVCETAAAGKYLTQKELAKVVGVSEKTVCTWRHDHRFKRAVNLAILEGFECSPWLLAELAAVSRAIRGSVPDWKTYLENGGPTSWRGPLFTQPKNCL
jgi:hypothetical protein